MTDKFGILPRPSYLCIVVATMAGYGCDRRQLVITMNEQTYRKMVERFTRFLETRHLKKTPERYAILARVMKLPPHFEADDLRRALDEGTFHVSRATVYNTVELLCECGVLRRLMLDPRRVRYEVTDSNHLHLVCSHCGALTEADAPELQQIMESSRIDGFTPSYYTMCVYGICDACRRAAECDDEPYGQDN